MFGVSVTLLGVEAAKGQVWFCLLNQLVMELVSWDGGGGSGSGGGGGGHGSGRGGGGGGRGSGGGGGGGMKWWWECNL